MRQYEFNPSGITSKRQMSESRKYVEPPRALLTALPESELTTFNRYLENWEKQFKKGLYQ